MNNIYWKLPIINLRCEESLFRVVSKMAACSFHIVALIQGYHDYKED